MVSIQRDGGLYFRLVGGEEHLVVDHHAVTLGVDHAEDRHQLLDIAAKHAERDLVAGIAIAVHVMVAKVGQRGLELVDVGGNPHAGLLQPTGVDVESDRAAPDPAAPAVRQRVDVAARGGGGEPGLRHLLEQRGDVGRPLVDQVVERDQQPEATVLYLVRLAEDAGEEQVGQIAAGERQVLLLLDRVVGHRLPLDVDVGHLLEHLRHLEVVPVGRLGRQVRLPGHHGEGDLVLHDRLSGAVQVGHLRFSGSALLISRRPQRRQHRGKQQQRH